MRPEVSEGLKSLLLSYNEKTPKLAIELGLIDFCKQHGADVEVGRYYASGLNASETRHFLINFKTSEEAIHFAGDVSRVTYGFTGVMIDVTSGSPASAGESEL